LCKVLKGNAARLHSDAEAVTEGITLEATVLLGEKLENAGLGVFLKT